jgi:hypothetical protein
VPVIILDHLTEAQRRAYRIADNKLTELGGWDDALLAQELHALNGDGFDLSLTGLDEAELDRLMGELVDEAEGTAGEDEIPEPPVDPVTRPGDLWVLGRHRLLCGDSTSAQDVGRLLGGAVPHLMITDPPYGVEYDPSWRNEAGVSTTSRTGKAANDDRADWREARCFQAMCLCLACRRPCLHGGRQSGCIRIRELKSAYELESGGTPCTSIRRGMTHQSPSRSPMRVAKIL